MEPQQREAAEFCSPAPVPLCRPFHREAEITDER